MLESESNATVLINETGNISAVILPTIRLNKLKLAMGDCLCRHINNPVLFIAVLRMPAKPLSLINDVIKNALE